MLYSLKGNYPSPLPETIVLSTGATRTDSSTFTDAEITDAGYLLIEDYPNIDPKFQRVEWNSFTLSWNIIPKTVEEIYADINRKWDEIRAIRNQKLTDTDWTQLMDSPYQGLQTYREAMTNYRQELRNITLQQDPYNIVWPEKP